MHLSAYYSVCTYGDMQSTMPCQDLVTVMSTLALLRRKAKFALAVQQQLQQALSLANTHKLPFDCCMTVDFPSLQQHAK